MAQTRIWYRLRIRNDADSANVIVLSSLATDPNALLCEAPEGDGQSIDPIMGTLEVGSYTWVAIDRFDGGDSYTITALLSDVDARNQILSNKCIGEYSTDGTTWLPLHTGYLNDLKLSDAKTYTFIVGDTDRRERDAKLFKTTTATFDKVSNLIGGPVEGNTPVAWAGTPTRSWGPLLDYGPARFVVIANPSGLVNPTNRVTLSLVGGNLPPRYLGQQGVWTGKVPNPAEYIDQKAYQYFEADAAGIYATDITQDSQPWGSFPQLEVKLRRVSDSVIFTTFPIAQASKKASQGLPVFPGGPDFGLGDYSALVANSNDWLIVAWDVATMGAQPSVGVTFDGWVRPIVISEDNPLHLRGHPVDLHRLANTELGIADDSVSAGTTKTAIGDLFYELRITDEWEYSKFTEMLKSSAGYAVRYNAAGVQEFFPTRAPQPDTVDTITSAKIIGDDRGEPQEVIFRVSEGSAIKGVDFKLQQFRLWNPSTDSASDRPVDGIVANDLTINGKRRDESVFGSKIITFEVPGMIMLAGGATVLNQPLALRDFIIAAGEVIIDRAGWGWAEGEVEVLATMDGKIGEYLDCEAPHQVNAKVGQSPVTQRGGTRKMQIVSATEMPGTRKLKLKDAGNVAQDAPEAPDDGGSGEPFVPVPELSLAPSVDSPFTIATVTETNVADLAALGADTDLEYLVQTATPASTDSGASFGPLLSSTGADTIDAPAIASGETIWVRGQAVITALGQRSEWSAWISITLGPDDDGTGGTLPALELTLTIDDAGSVSAAATGIADIVKVYFAGGAPVGVSPSFADVLAGATDESVPFEAPDLQTIAEGETLIVGAIGEDALGNRTILATKSITRKVNSGEAEGTPGNFRITFIGSPPEVVRNVGADLRVPKAAIRAALFVNTALVGAMRGQLGNHRASGAGVEVPIVYSLDNGSTWAEAGPTISVAAIGFPRVGAFTALVDDAIGENVLISWGVKGGSGTTVVEIGNFYIEATSAVEPPDSPIPSDLPQGGPFGNIIHDEDAIRQEADDGDPIPVVTDFSVSGDDATPDGSAGQTAPTMVRDAYGPGLDAMRFDGVDNGVRHPNPTGASFTRFFLCAYNTPASPSGGVLFNATTGGNNALNAAVRNDGKILAQVNDQFIFPSTDTTDDAFGGMVLHLHCWVFDKNSGHWKWFTDDMGDADVQAEADCQAAFTSDAVNVWQGSRSGVPLEIDWCREVTYDAPQGATQRNAVKSAFVAAGWPI